MTRLVEVEPIHGWGWTDGHDPVETPAPFSCALIREGDELVGRIQGKHLLSGWECRLSRRHVEQDGCCNAKLIGRDARLSGFAVVPVETFA